MSAADPTPAPASGTLTLGRFLPYRLSVLSAVVSEGLARLYGERFGIGIPEWRVLATVGQYRSITAGRIGRHAHMGKVKVSRAAASLEAAGLIRRQPNEEDLREAFLVLTGPGERVYGEIVPIARDYARRLTDALTSAEAAALDRIIDKLLLRSQEMRD